MIAMIKNQRHFFSMSMKKFRKESKNKIETNLIYFYFLLVSKSSKSKIKTISEKRIMK